MNIQIDCTLPTWLGFVFQNNTVLLTSGRTAPFNNFAPGYSPPPYGYIYSNGWTNGGIWKVDNANSSFAFACQYRPSQTTEDTTTATTSKNCNKF